MSGGIPAWFSIFAVTGAETAPAATGGLTFDRRGLDRLPSTYALYRVSEATVETARRQLARAEATYGPDDKLTHDARRHLRALSAAQRSGQAWLRQDEDWRRLTRADVASRHGRLRRFQGKLAILTDRRCMSACLDFLDQVRLVPGAIHLGQITSADSVYMEVATVPLPSGNALRFPMKVWRNRIRGDNEPVVPDRIFSGDISQDDEVIRWTLSELRR